MRNVDLVDRKCTGTHRHASKHTHRQTDRKKNKQTDRHKHAHTVPEKENQSVTWDAARAQQVYLQSSNYPMLFTVAYLHR